MTVATDFRGRLHRSISRLGSGSNVSVRKRTQAHDPGAGTVVETNTDTAVVAAVADYLDRDRDGSLVLVGDKKVHVSAKSVSDAGLTLSEGDALLIGGVEHEIVDLEVVAPAGVVEGYVAQVRR